MKYTQEAQGMYDPRFEKDACGIGAIAHIKGIKSHNVVENSLSMLAKMEHRGGAGADEKVGDGAGLLIQIPHKLFKKVCEFSLPEATEYAVAMCFFPKESDKREVEKKNFVSMLEEKGLKVIGCRQVPIDASDIGEAAKVVMPYMEQIFIEKPKTIESQLEFEKLLYRARRKFEKASEDSYIVSLSSKTIVYKGMLSATQMETFYLDLLDEDCESAIAMVHSRFSTNTFPSWEKAHPNRYMIHNGEINTIRGNVNWVKAREAALKSEVFGEQLQEILPVVGKQDSDSAMLDNTVEFLYMNGRTLPQIMMMLVPEPWSKNTQMPKNKRDFYEYYSTMMEPWDGPAALAFTDGEILGATLDRNGLRPSRFYVTNDDFMILSSEVGVLDIDEATVVKKGRLTPGRMLLVDTKQGTIIDDTKLKETYSNMHPYGDWVSENLIKLDNVDATVDTEVKLSVEERTRLQKAFGFTFEDVMSTIKPMCDSGQEPLSAMGIDSPLAVLSEKPQPLFNYFKQMFAQVTNPPIDAIREEIVTSVRTYLGAEGNLLSDVEANCRRIKLSSPIVIKEEMDKILSLEEAGFKSEVISIVFDKTSETLEEALERVFEKAEAALKDGKSLLVLSDRVTNEKLVPIPSLLAVAAVHHHFIRLGNRTEISIVLESGEPREVHHFATLIGYGVNAIYPYLAYESIKGLCEDGLITLDYAKAVYNYRKASVKGIVKVLSKMGISTIQSYNGAQIFQAIGIASETINKYFTGTSSPINGIGIKEIEKEAVLRHIQGFDKRNPDLTLESDGEYRYRSNKEEHLYNPLTIHKLQNSCRNGSYEEFKEFSSLINKEDRLMSLRNLLDFDFVENPIPLDEVESVESIVKRFKTGAMSFGSISREAHQCLAIAMNKIGAKSNTGEGGEERDRFSDSRRSAIKQVASGRFGVTSEYLVNSDEIQIKIAQGAKPGEGGQLPANKVYPWVAKARNSTPFVGLISPPPHHDIYSIEDLAQLIYDLKNANPDAKINVKLVSEAGVGTIAAGVAKGGAEVILISGYDGGTGASPKNSIKHAGLPWELGLAETHQTLVLNGLRNRLKIETDGKLLTGRDIAIAAMLGAEEFGFATGPLVVMGCVMMRVCNLDTCPVGIATQNEELRKRFTGDPEHVVNYMMFMARELREYMAKLGFRTVEEMVGRTDKLKKKNLDGWKTKNIDLSKILHKPESSLHMEDTTVNPLRGKIDETIDAKTIIPACEKAIENKEKVTITVNTINTDRTLGTLLGSKISKKYGEEGLPEDTITINVNGTGGQSFGAFVPRGVTLSLVGDSNDYVGKGLSGGKIIIREGEKSTLNPRENIIIGNVALYGATAGKVFIKGIAGERFAVRNSGVEAVVEGVGDHGCEYMTGGKVVVLGTIGRNFGAGMSGGIAYILDEENSFKEKINEEMVFIETVEAEDEAGLLGLIKEHYENTNSEIAKAISLNFDSYKGKFIKIMPKEYKKALKERGI
ncbi:glutamate synthase large subunit [Clostridium cellulovorans]|uniref:Glutamate synthase (Ferredoxin) n=1 Tax=Clostridium cellulovorans (strain ATCC 35296 / DSM 3052 / OCM 3 / 743B) TaxID=573061 RepID=D9SRD6_CLOC7|nr:glutamate synthase large subunit [Clostridium cellulovorans]ADL52365.1 Glutamate synthase (ferredoxin) [Clostridium cellulovorans 743B]